MPKSTTPTEVQTNLAKLMLSILVLMFNPASVNAEDGSNDSPRDSTPWFVMIPTLGISVMARDAHNNPVTGYWELSDAQMFAQSLYIRCKTDPAFLASLREKPEQPVDISTGYKLMHRLVSVPSAL